MFALRVFESRVLSARVPACAVFRALTDRERVLESDAVSESIRERAAWVLVMAR